MAPMIVVEDEVVVMCSPLEPNIVAGLDGRPLLPKHFKVGLCNGALGRRRNEARPVELKTVDHCQINPS
nr:hypothetical protein Iba_chr15fCG2410 [Ipomoea batatas]